MDIRKITETYHVSPQIEPSDPAALAAGYARIICNRPDAENPPALQAEAISAAAKEAGIDFVALPLTHQTMTADNVALQRSLVDDAGGPVLAYCASGTRCSVIWALGQAQTGDLDVDEILRATAEAGYDLAGLRPTLSAIRG